MHDPKLQKIEGTLKDFVFPTRFAVEITAHCNLACTMCHHPGMRRPKGKMPFALWARCADQIAEISPEKTEVWFSFCGEPLLEPDLLFRMLRYGREVGLRSQNINTNGIPLRPVLFDPLLSSGVDRIVIGMDGFEKETYESIRVRGDRDRLYRNVELLLEARRARAEGPEIMVQFILMDENENEVDAFREYWLERGATLKIRNKLSWGGTLDSPMDVPDEERIACPWALTMMHVFWDGRVPRCSGDTEGEEGPGNAWHTSLKELWNRMRRYRGLHLEHRFDELPDRCRSCSDWMVGAAERVRPDTDRLAVG